MPEVSQHLRRQGQAVDLRQVWPTKGSPNGKAAVAEQGTGTSCKDQIPGIQIYVSSPRKLRQFNQWQKDSSI